MRCVPSSIKLDGESNRFIEVFFAKIFFMVLKIKINENVKKMKKPIFSWSEINISVVDHSKEKGKKEEYNG